MPQVILRPYYLTFRNKFLRAEDRTRARKKALMVLFIAATVMLCIYTGTTLILNSINALEVFSIVIPTKLVEIGFYLLFFLLLISDTVSAIGTFYSAERFDLIIISPKSKWRIFLAKQLEILFETGVMLVIFCSPVILAYIHKLNLSYVFLFYCAVVTFLYMLIPLSLSFILATIFVKFSALFWKNGKLLLSALAVAIVFAVYKIVVVFNDAPKGSSDGGKAIVKMVSLFDNPNPPWFPGRWASDLVNSHISTQNSVSNLQFALLGTSTAILFLFSFLVFKHVFLTVRSTAAANSKKSALRRNKNSILTNLSKTFWLIVYQPKFLGQQLGAIVIKDMKSLIRDRAQALQLLMYLLIVTVYITLFKFMTIAVNLNSTAQQSWWAFLASINVLFAGFILTALMTRLVYPSISLEGKAFYILKTSPLLLSGIIKAKFYCWFPITTTVVLSLLGAGLLAIEASTATVFITAITGVSLSIGATGLAIGIGCWFANFEWETPNQISAGFGTLLLLLAGLALVLLTNIPAAVLTWVSVVPDLRRILGPTITFTSMTLSLFLVIFLNLSVADLFLKKGLKALTEQTS